MRAAVRQRCAPVVMQKGTLPWCCARDIRVRQNCTPGREDKNQLLNTYTQELAMSPPSEPVDDP